MNNEEDTLAVSKGRRIGYARIAPTERRDESETRVLRCAGCDQIYIEHQAEQDCDWPVLDGLLADLRCGDTVIVPRLGKLARSTPHLLTLLEAFDGGGVSFQSLEERLDTSAPGGSSAIHLIRSIIQLERDALAAKTRAGVEKAKAEGRLPGNPSLRARRPDALLSLSRSRQKAYLGGLRDSTPAWLPLVRELRPLHSWDSVVRVLNLKGQSWTVERLRRAVHRLVEQNLAEPALLERSPRREPKDRLMKVVAAIAVADPGLSLRAIGAKLDELGEVPSRGGRKWQASSIRNLLDEARRFGLIPRSYDQRTRP
ncbi:MAG: recombinase family protein [Pseudorhizobium sp.]